MDGSELASWIAVALVILGGIGAGMGTLYSSRQKGERDGMAAALQELEVMTRKADRLQGENDTLSRQLRTAVKEREILEETIAKALRAAPDA